jgi:hypothetical protein
MFRFQMLKPALFFVAILLGGCATFNPASPYQALLNSSQPTASQIHAGIQLSLEEFISSEKSRRAFDADLAAYGVLAILLKAENRSQTTYSVDEKETKAFLGSRLLPALSGIDAANRAGSRDYVSKAAVWTLATGPFALFLWPAIISTSGTHTTEVNRGIEQHFQSLAFGKAIMKPAQTAAGFLYFRLPEDWNGQDQIVIQITARETENNKPISFNLALPSLASVRNK